MYAETNGVQKISKCAVSVVIGTYNRKRFLEKTIETLRDELDNAPFKSEMIVVDGGSTDGTLNWLKKQKDTITIIQHNRGKWHGKQIERRSWGYFMNLGFKCAQGKYICMLSDDCLVVPGAIVNGYHLFEKKLEIGDNVGAVAFYWRNWPEMKNYWIGYTLGGKLFVNHGMYLNSAVRCVDYIDEDFKFYFADGDLCLKLWKSGYQTIPSEESYIEHLSHANCGVRRTNSMNNDLEWEKYLLKWGGIYYKESGITGYFKEKQVPSRYKLAEKYWRFDGYIIKLRSMFGAVAMRMIKR